MSEIEAWARHRLGVADEPSDAPPDVATEALNLPDEAKAQIRSWGKDRPPVPGNPPQWVDNEAAWERAKRAVEKYWGNYSEPWAVVAHVYQQMTGT